LKRSTLLQKNLSSGLSGVLEEPGRKTLIPENSFVDWFKSLYNAGGNVELPMTKGLLSLS